MAQTKEPLHAAVAMVRKEASVWRDGHCEVKE